MPGHRTLAQVPRLNRAFDVSNFEVRLVHFMGTLYGIQGSVWLVLQNFKALLVDQVSFSCVEDGKERIQGEPNKSLKSVFFKKTTGQVVSHYLRTVPTIVTAHTFCASQDTRVSYGLCLLIQGYFCAV